MAVGAATFAALALLWYAATSVTHAIPPVYFPTPAEVAQALQQITIRGYADGKLHEHFFHSSLLVLMGFAAAVAIGVPLGMLMGWSRRAEALINPVFLLLRPIPPLAWIPLAIVWLGLGDAAKVMVIWFAAFIPAVINSYAGVLAGHRPQDAGAGSALSRFAAAGVHGSSVIAAGLLDDTGRR
jgi:NitT/TauT family transport system permease protein/taurine transport system permease protein